MLWSFYRSSGLFCKAQFGKDSNQSPAEESINKGYAKMSRWVIQRIVRHKMKILKFYRSIVLVHKNHLCFCTKKIISYTHGLTSHAFCIQYLAIKFHVVLMPLFLFLPKNLLNALTIIWRASNLRNDLTIIWCASIQRLKEN